MLPNELCLYFDGSCFPKNPGGIAGFAWRLVDSDGKEIKSDSGEVCRGPEATNNVAEWAAVTHGLRYLADQKWSGRLQVLGDSQLVIRQLLGEYRVKKDTLIPYYQESIQLLQKWDHEIIWIPREKNNECDQMSRKT